MKTTLFVIFLLGITVEMYSHNLPTQPSDCRYWKSRVDATVVYTPDKSTHAVFPANGAFFSVESQLVDQGTFLKAAKCLLSLKGNAGPAKFQGATRPNVSQTFGPARVDVAALYYLSYLFIGRFDHADAVSLVDASGRDVEERVRIAFDLYGKWVQTIKKRGIEAARKENLDPLAGSGIKWY